ncbi:MAG: hypothetical protein ACXVZT_08035 [Terriglobales bacterium]
MPMSKIAGSATAWWRRSENRSSNWRKGSSESIAYEGQAIQFVTLAGVGNEVAVRARP